MALLTDVMARRKPIDSRHMQRAKALLGADQLLIFEVARFRSLVSLRRPRLPNLAFLAPTRAPRPLPHAPSL